MFTFIVFVRFFGIDRTIKNQVSLISENKARAETINLAHNVIKVLQIYSIEKNSLGKFVFHANLSDLIVSLNETAELKNLLTESDVEMITTASVCETHCPKVLLIDYKNKKQYERHPNTLGEVVYKAKNCKSAMCKDFEVEIRYVGPYETFYDSEYFDKE